MPGRFRCVPLVNDGSAFVAENFVASADGLNVLRFGGPALPARFVLIGLEQLVSHIHCVSFRSALSGTAESPEVGPLGKAGALPLQTRLAHASGLHHAIARRALC